MFSERDDLPSPEELILNPFKDDGLATIHPPAPFWQPVPVARINGFSASEHPEITEKIDAFVARTIRHRAFNQALVFNSFPVVMDNVTIDRSSLAVGGKCPVAGAAGVRLLNRYCYEGTPSGTGGEAALMRYFSEVSRHALRAEFPIYREPLPSQTPFVIEARNTFNYYHFLCETLCQLCLVEQAGVHGPIFIHYPNSDDKTGAFCMAFIRTLFPELADRVIFQRVPARYDRAVGG